MLSTPERAKRGEVLMVKGFFTIPCSDHAFDEDLVCKCGMGWSVHQRHPERCPVNARGQNRGAPRNAGTRPRARRMA